VETTQALYNQPQITGGGKVQENVCLKVMPYKARTLSFVQINEKELDIFLVLVGQYRFFE